MKGTAFRSVAAPATAKSTPCENFEPEDSKYGLKKLIFKLAPNLIWFEEEVAPCH